MLKKIRSYVLNIVKILLIFFIIQNIFTPKCSAASALENIKNNLASALESIKNFAASAGESIKNGFASAGESIENGFASAGESIKNFAASAVESIKKNITIAKDAILEAVLPEEDDEDVAPVENPDAYKTTFVDPTENPDAYKPTIQDEENSLKDKTSNLLGAINTLGIVVSVISLTLIGIKYMLGSVEEKAEYKKTMIPYVLGFIMLSASTTIANLLYNISSDIFG